MKVATWNVHNIAKRLPLLLEELDVTHPDVVALQELKCAEPHFSRVSVQVAGYGSLVCGPRTQNGVALLVRGEKPVELRRAGACQQRKTRHTNRRPAGTFAGTTA